MPGVPARIVVDSGPLIALFDAGDAFHAQAIKFVRELRAPLVSSMAVLTEAMYVLDESLKAQKNLLTWIQAGGLALIEPDAADFDRVSALMEKFSDLPMDFADAVVVALCEKLGSHHIASVDRDFTIYRYKRRTKFVNVFFE